MNLEKEIFDIELSDIMPNRFQPREIFDDEALMELSESIKAHGVIQPIIVRKVGDKYEIVAGERRYRASQLAGKETIPALVRDIDDKEAAKIALLENLQRRDLTPIEEAKTYQTILKLDNITQDELAQNLGKSQSAIANKLRLLNLAEEVQTALLNNQISERHARSLLTLDNKNQISLLNKVIKERLTVRQLDEEILNLTGKRPIEESGDENNGFNQFTPQASLASSSIETPIVATNLEQLSLEKPNTETFKSELPPVDNKNVPEVNIDPEPAETKENIIEQSELKSVELPIGQQIEENNLPNIELTEQQPEENTLPNIAQTEQQPEENILPNDVSTEEAQQAENSVLENQTQHNNIFDKLRVAPNQAPEDQPELENNQVSEQPLNELNVETPIISQTPEQPIQTDYNNIYDLRFAINNFRQAIQNTEKFGFKITAEEYDNQDSYQIVIKIDKNS